MGYEPTIWQDGDTITSVRLNKLEQGAATMGYEPTIWQDGDTITSVRLNKLEQGVATLSNESLGELVEISTSADNVTFYVATTAFDITGNIYAEVDTAAREHANVCCVMNALFAAPSECYVAITYAVSSEWSPESTQVYAGETTVSDFECKKFNSGSFYFAFFTMQIPPAEEIYVDFGSTENEPL